MKQNQTRTSGGLDLKLRKVFVDIVYGLRYMFSLTLSLPYVRGVFEFVSKYHALFQGYKNHVVFAFDPEKLFVLELSDTWIFLIAKGWYCIFKMFLKRTRLNV